MSILSGQFIPRPTTQFIWLCLALLILFLAYFGIRQPDLYRIPVVAETSVKHVNYFRIKEFVALAKTERARELTLFGLAQEAGFNSKTTFNKAFRELMGTSPGAYFREKA